METERWPEAGTGGEMARTIIKVRMCNQPRKKRKEREEESETHP